MRRPRQIGQREERAARMRPATCLQDCPRLAIDLVKSVVAAVGVGLKDPGVARQMCLRMLAATVARVIEHRRRRCPAAKGSIITDINPTSSSIGLALG